jgi:hypothetical protein
MAAARAGIARSTWERIETGVPNVTLASLVAATDAVGLDLVIQTYQGRAPSLRDSGQLTIAQALTTATHRIWKIALEVRAGDHGEAIDMVLRGPEEIVAIEIERMAVDWQLQYRRASIKRDWLSAQADRPVRLVIAVTDSRRNRVALAPFMEVIRQSLPAGTGRILRSLRSGMPLGLDGLLWIRPRHGTR